MRVGIIVSLHGTEGSTPGWPLIREQVATAERIGCDLAVLADAMLYRAEDGDHTGYWESVSMAAALAAATDRIELGHSVINAPYRSAALTAKIAETIDEISSGRFFLGIGLGNTPDYDQVGVRADHRYSRFEETIQVIHRLLRTGTAAFEGHYQFARDAALVPRGPRPAGPPIVIAAKGPRMLRLAARYADGWNWWIWGDPDPERLRPIADELDRACEEVGRDPGTLARSLDVYSLDPIGRFTGTEAIGGSPDESAEMLLRYRDLGFDEVRLNMYPVDDMERLPGAVEALAPVVEHLHAG